jgi:hypothetical protein
MHMQKLGSLILLGYLLYGTVAADRCQGGPTTAGYSQQLLLGALVLLAFFVLGFWIARRYRSFLGFSPWQWNLLSPAALFAGVIIRLLMF